MKNMTRRGFLRLSAATGAVTWLAGCMPIQPPTPEVQPAAEASSVVAPTPLQEVNLLDADALATVEKTIEFQINLGKVPGMVVGIVKDGEVVYAKSFGVSRIDSEEPVTLQSIFQVMDLTHTFTALAALQLVEQGKLDLDAPVVEYLPYFQLADERYKQITMRHLLAECAGLPHSPGETPVLDWKDKTVETDSDALELYVRSLSNVRLETDPGALYEFCNMAYDVAGDVIAKASGEVFEDYMEQHVLAPLGMTSSTFYPDKVDPDQRVTAHVLKRATDAEVSDVGTWSRERAPSVGLFTNLDDLTRWIMVHLNRGELDGQRILQEASFDQLWQPVMELGWGSEYQYKALAWDLGTSHNHPVRQYWGGDVGFHGSFYLAPEEKIGAVALGNLFTSDSWTPQYAYYITSLSVPAVAQW